MSDRDETKGTPKDESKGKGTPKDESKGTPKDKGKLFTPAEIDRIKADSASMAQGRAEKVAKQEKDALTQELESIKGRFDALEAQANETRLAEARGDPVKLQSYQRDQAVGKREREVADRERDLVRREGLLKTAQEELKQTQGTVSVAYVAASHGLKVEDLEEFSDLSPEALEKLAVKLETAAGGKPKGEDDADRQAYQALGTDAEKVAFVKAHPDFESEALKLDSGEGGGSGEKTEQEKLDERYPTMKTK